MSRFFSSKYDNLVPYTPGEQPRDMQYIKLNTNESPFPPSDDVVAAAAKAAGRLQLYSDPTCMALREKIANLCGVTPQEVLPTNGSDEALNFAFLAFCDEQHPVAFADLTYGFYKVFADVYNIPTQIIPLKEDFTIDIRDYFGLNKTIFIANPNAPTGLVLQPDQIEEIVKKNPDGLVVVDEAYVDFGNRSCIPLVREYDNLLVIQTFSKSRSMAGARLGFAVGCKELIADLDALRFSTNPFNVNMMTMSAGIAVLENDAKTWENCREIIRVRTRTEEQLKDLGFRMTSSNTNFVFGTHPSIGGEELYLKLKARGILVRHFKIPRIEEYVRITIGTSEQMEKLVQTVREILEEKQ